MTRRLALFVAVAGVALTASAAAAGATGECRGLPVCVPVAGPWVVVQGGTRAPRPRTEYQLSCPLGYVVGGLDAELSHRGIELVFLGGLGSPVNPGITTSQTVRFGGTYVGATRATPSYRPHIGCLPSSGGGARRPVAVSTFAPGQPTVSRVREELLEPGARRSVTHGCFAGERLVASWHALGFYTAGPPSERQVASVAVARTLRAGRVTVTVRVGAALRNVRAAVQVGAVCAGGE